METDEVHDLRWVETAPLSNLKWKKTEKLKFLSLRSPCSCEDLILQGYERFREGSSYSCQQGIFQHLPAHSTICTPVCTQWSLQLISGLSFHCHLPTGSYSSASSPNLLQCCPTLPFSRALFVFLHSSIWIMSHRNKNHSRDTSDVWFHVSSFLYLAYSDGQSLEQGLLLLVLFMLQSRTMALQV